MKFRNSPGNINNSIFPRGKLNYVMHFGEKKNRFFFSPRSGFIGQNFIGGLSGVDSAGALRQGVLMLFTWH